MEMTEDFCQRSSGEVKIVCAELCRIARRLDAESRRQKRIIANLKRQLKVWNGQ